MFRAGSRAVPTTTEVVRQLIPPAVSWRLMFRAGKQSFSANPTSSEVGTDVYHYRGGKTANPTSSEVGLIFRAGQQQSPPLQRW
jgi:hypothetical protein